MSQIGYRPGSVADAYASLTTADVVNQRATISAKMPEHGWGYRRGIRGGRVTAATPAVALPVWATDAGPSPDALLGTTDPINTGTVMTSAADGTEYTADLQSAVMLRAGKRYALGFVAANARFGYGYLSTGDLPAGEYGEEYLRTVGGITTAQDPFGYTSNTSRGWIATWLDYEPNVPPAVPTTRSPVADAVVVGLDPTFAGDFRDDNEALPGGIPGGDELARYSVEVRAKATGVAVWSTTRNASAAERTARRFSVGYVGPALTAGTAYEWRCLVRDRFDEASAWSTWLTFTSGAGTVTVGATPTGVQQTRQPGPFVGTWAHPTARTAVALGVRIEDEGSGGVVMEGTGSLGTPVASGGTVSISWTASLGTDRLLAWGGRYAYRLQARDQDGILSGWSARRAFSVNAPPSVPDPVVPLDGETITNRPILVAEVTDPDDTQLTGLSISCRIKDGNGALLYTRAMPYASQRTLLDGTVVYRYAYATTSTDLPATGNYRWDAWATDGTIYSNGGTTLGAAALAAEQTFTYAVGPAITHVGPADGAVVATDAPTYDWSVTNQIRYRVQVWSGSDVDFLVWDSGEVESTATQVDQPPGFLENGGEYYRVVHAWNAANQHGISAPTFFSVDYTEPDPVGNVVWSPHRVQGDATPTAGLLSWDATTYGDQFGAYVLTRRAADGTALDVDDPVGDRAVRIARITSPSQTRFVDYLPASGVTYVYAIKQEIKIGGQSFTSVTTHVEGRVDFQETVICDVEQPGARRVVLPAREERRWSRNREQKVLAPWNSSKPTVIRTKRWGREMSPTVFPIVAATPDDATAVVRAIDAMDQGGGPLCYRDGRGARYFGELTAFEDLDAPGGRVRRVSLGFLQTSARETEA